MGNPVPATGPGVLMIVGAEVVTSVVATPPDPDGTPTFWPKFWKFWSKPAASNNEPVAAPPP